VGWAFFYMFVLLKIPVILALWLIWWAVRQEPEAPEERVNDEGGGGSPHPRLPRSRPPRRGPHAGPTPGSPARTRVPRRQLTPHGR
jgi:hypothetical protein